MTVESKLIDEKDKVGSRASKRKRYLKALLFVIALLLFVFIGISTFGLIRSNQRLKAALQTAKQREEKRARNAAFLKDFRKVSQAHNAIKEKVFFLYQGQDWQVEFKPQWEMANNHEADREKVEEAINNMKEFLSSKEHELKILESFVEIEKKNINSLARTAQKLEPKEAALAKQMVQEMKDANDNAREVTNCLSALLVGYNSFCEKRTALLRAEITAEEFNQFGAENNDRITKTSKEIDSLIDKNKSFDGKIKELYEKIWLLLTK